MTTPWLDDMRASLGVRETKGKASTAAIREYFRDCGWELDKLGDDTSVPWCAARLGSALKRSGLPIPPKNVNLLARSYLTLGVACAPKPGAIAVWPRGSPPSGHVNIVETVTEDGKVICIGGNQSDAVTRTKPMDPKTALGFRWPVAATVPDLRKAGSTEIRKGDSLQVWGILSAKLSLIVAAVKELLSPVTQVPQHDNIGDSLSFWQSTLEAANALARVVLDNPWVAGAVASGLCMAFVGHTIKKHRVAKAEAGIPLSMETARA